MGGNRLLQGSRTPDDSGSGELALPHPCHMQEQSLCCGVSLASPAQGMEIKCGHY